MKKILHQTDQDRQLERLFAYVHFIDEGFGVWLNTVISFFILLLICL